MRLDKLIEERLATSRKEMKRLFSTRESLGGSANRTEPISKCRQSIA